MTTRSLVAACALTAVARAAAGQPSRALQPHTPVFVDPPFEPNVAPAKSLTFNVVVQ